MYGKTFDDQFHLPVNIITLDSPVMGCSSFACYNYDEVLNVPSAKDMRDPDIIERMLAARGSSTPHYSAVTTVTVYSAANGSPSSSVQGDMVVTYHSAHPTDLEGKFRGAGTNRVPQVKDINECSAWPSDRVACHSSVLADPDVKAWIGRILAPKPDALPTSGRGGAGTAGGSSTSSGGTVSGPTGTTASPASVAPPSPVMPAPLPPHR